MVTKPITTQRDYQRSLEEIEGLMTAKGHTPEGKRLEALVTLVEAWETEHEALSDETDAKLELRDRRVRRVEDFTAEEMEALAKAEVPPEYAYLDEELKDWTP